MEGRNRDLTATSEILRTIAHAPTDTQPVFDTIVRSAARLCHAVMAAVMLTDGRMLYLPANYGSSPEALAAVRARYPRPVDVETSSGEAILTRSVVHVPDVEEASVPEFTRQNGRMMGFRSLVTVPMLREGEVVGAITVCRLEPGRFSDTEVALLKTFADQAVIAIENVRLFTELQEKNRALTRAHGQVSEALERQTGTSEILRAISSSPTNVQPVFDTIVESAARLCSAESAAAYRFEGEVAYFAAGFHFSSESVEAYRRQFPRPLRETDHLQRVVGGSVLNIADIENDPHSSSRVRDVYRSRGVRSTVLVPMLREGRAIGAIGVSHHDLAAFSDERVELLKTFADQAVIAIENVRLFKELQQRNSEVTEALEQKTATSEILRVISGSPTDTRPVFETIAQSAVRLCGSLFSAVFTFTDGLMWLVAHRNFSPDAVKAMEALYPARPGRETGAGRAILDRTIIEITDVLSDPEYGRDLQSRGGWRSTFAVPMLREGTPIGAIAVGWAEPGPASPGNIALLQTFADQAVIAIENVRLFKELEARNRDLTATSEILQVIARSPTDVQPVFNTIAERAMRLCDAAFGVVLMFDGALIHLSALANVSPGGVDALRQAFPVAPSRGTTSGRVILTGDVVQIPDALDDPEYKLTKFAHVENFRCTLGVPMLHQGRAIGVIVVTRPEPGTFSEEQVQLLKTFADQAVIAIENVRLFTELEARNRDLTEALEQQTATSEILRVISSSPTDLQPVLDTVVKSAARFCGAYDAELFHLDGGTLRLAAHHGPLRIPLGLLVPVVPGTVGGRSVLERRAVHTADVQAEAEEFPEGSAFARDLGYRTILAVPLLREGEAIGTIALRRTEVSPFTDKQIALLQTFADQAVIAIENVRLFKELEARNRDITEALEQQTATSEILRVISSSPTDVQPVFDIIGERAERLCAAEVSLVSRFDGELIQLVALHGVAQEGVEAVRRAFPMQSDAETVTARAFRNCTVIHIPDVLADPLYQHKDEARAGGYRGGLGVPMVREGQVIGVIFVARRTPGYFTDSQVELLKTFADQAIIAIENVRLFKELQEKNRALTQAHAQVSESLEQKTATSEILRVISGSPTDVQPTFEAIVRSAVRLCDALIGAVVTFDGEMIRTGALYNYTPDAQAAVQRMYPMRPSRQQLTGRAILSRTVVHLPDVLNDPEYASEIARAGGWRGGLAVPMLREGTPIGAILVMRAQPGPFSDRQIELLQTFADQAIIAIENVRLFKELEVRNRDLTEALEQQTATAEILKVISGSPTDVQPVFDTIVANAVNLCGARMGAVHRFDGELVHLVAQHNFPPEALEVLRRMYPRPPQPDQASGRAILSRTVAQIEDMLADPQYTREVALASGWRSILAVPMLRDGAPIGAIVITRSEAGPFSDGHVELLKTFADQAIIAIENVRLFQELQARTHELGRSVDELKALGEVSQAVSSTLDLETVLTTIVSRANHLSGTDGGAIYEYDESHGEFRLRVTLEFEDELIEALRAAPVQLGEGAVGRAGVARQPIQIPDILDEATYTGRLREVAERAGYRALLAVPLLREDRLVGALVLRRRVPGSFPQETIELLQTFAAQSVLAIQNARLFREIEEKGRQLEAASRHKSEFLANMSHELRTPLNAILGFNEMILGEVYGDVPPDLKEPLTDIQNSGQHLLRLINNVLDLSKIEAGRMELALTDYAVQDTVEKVRVSLHPLAAAKGLEFVASVPQDIPLAYGDAGRITQCLMNLAGNALKFTRQGRVGLSVDLQGDLLVYRVADTGIGISKDKIETVFAEFRQGDATITSEFGGTGLGLSITKKFVEMHRGRIWVESELGKGSTFFFAIPLRLAGGKPA